MSDQTFEIRGAEQLMRRLAGIGPAGMRMAAAGLYQEALVIKEKAFHRCPKDTGNLRNSHTVSRPTVTSRDVSVTIGAGGPAAPYAIYVHENLEAHHPIGEAKWLERTIQEAAPDLAENVGRRIDLNRAR